MTTLYDASAYLDFDQLDAIYQDALERLPQWIERQTIGHTLGGLPIEMLIIGHQDEDRARRPALWIDGGTHASEWTSVSAAIYALSRWVDLLVAGDEATIEWFKQNTVLMVPCISPDGYDAMRKGHPFVRSNLRPSKPGTTRAGLVPMDMDGDNEIRWMRWKHPAGPFVPDEDIPLAMRPRTLDDSPDDAYFVCSEGQFMHWDGLKWVQAPRAFGLDLNRNFPAYWAPMSMFGMDSGSYPLSSPESRAVMDTFAKHPYISAALTFHTYTGCILTQPYRADSPLPQSDLKLIQRLAHELVRDTGYKVFKVCPEFMYDPKRAVGGVWAETISTVYGVPGYTVEFWDPYGFADVEMDKPAAFFLNPDYEKIKPLLKAFAQPEENPKMWTAFEHPQLGEVELGGIDYLRTVRNPPERLLAEECEKGWQMTARLMRALPSVEVSAQANPMGDGLFEVVLTLENTGYLSTSCTAYAQQINACAPMSVQWTLDQTQQLRHGVLEQPITHLAGWGDATVGAASHSIYPSLGASHREQARLLVQGEGTVRAVVHCGRAGLQTVFVTCGAS